MIKRRLRKERNRIEDRLLAQEAFILFNRKELLPSDLQEFMRTRAKENRPAAKIGERKRQGDGLLLGVPPKKVSKQTAISAFTVAISASSALTLTSSSSSTSVTSVSSTVSSSGPSAAKIKTSSPSSSSSSSSSSAKASSSSSSSSSAKSPVKPPGKRNKSTQPRAATVASAASSSSPSTAVSTTVPSEDDPSSEFFSHVPDSILADIYSEKSPKTTGKVKCSTVIECLSASLQRGEAIQLREPSGIIVSKIFQGFHDDCVIVSKNTTSIDCEEYHVGDIVC